MKKAIGIDLGTSHSSAAHVDRGFPEMIQISEEGYSIPSVVSLDQKGSFESQSNGVSIRHSKRMIGRNLQSDSQTQGYQQIFTYDIADSGTQNILYQIKEQAYTLEDISSEILKQVKQGAEQKLQTKIDAVVLTVPAYFNELQRKSIRTAGELAGLDVLRVINEPTAAALAYGFQQDMNVRIAVYDFGGGTFDLSMIDIQGSVFEVIATGGNPMLGGIDIDDCIVHWICAQFQNRTGIDISYRVDIYDQLRQLAESAKIILSKEDTTNISLHGMIHLPEISTDVQIELSRVQLEELVDHLVQQTIDCFDRLLVETATVKDELDTIILVGGQSKMPLVQQKLQNWFGREIDFSVHPDEAVALGGALMAEAIIQQEKNNTIFSLMDVLPLQIGIQRESGEIEILFEKHTPLPSRRKMILQTTKKRQRTLRFSLFQKGVSTEISQYDKIGDYYIKNLWDVNMSSHPNTPQNYVHIELDFSLADDGELSISGRNIQTNTVVPIDIQGIGTYTTFETTEPLPVIPSTLLETQVSVESKSKNLPSTHRDIPVPEEPQKGTESSIVPDIKSMVPKIESVSTKHDMLEFQSQKDPIAKDIVEPSKEESSKEEGLQEEGLQEEGIKKEVPPKVIPPKATPQVGVSQVGVSQVEVPPKVTLPEILPSEEKPQVEVPPKATSQENVSSQSLWKSFPEVSSPSELPSKAVHQQMEASSNQRNLWLQEESQNTPVEQKIVQSENSKPLWGENRNDLLMKEEPLHSAELNIADSWLDQNHQSIDSDDFFANVMENESDVSLSPFVEQKSVETSKNADKESIVTTETSIIKKDQSQTTEAKTLFPLDDQPVSSIDASDLDMQERFSKTILTSNNPHDHLQIPDFLEFGSEVNRSQPDFFEQDIVSDTKMSPLLSKEISSESGDQNQNNDLFDIPTREFATEKDPFSIFDVPAFDTEIDQNQPNPIATKSMQSTTEPTEDIQFSEQQDVSEQVSLQQGRTSSPFFTTQPHSNPAISKENQAPPLFQQQDPFELLDDNLHHDDDIQEGDDPFSSFLEDSQTKESLSNEDKKALFETSSNMFAENIFDKHDTNTNDNRSNIDAHETSTNSEWTMWSAEPSDPITEEIPFPIAGMGESIDMTNEGMFDNDMAHQNDPFHMFSENQVPSLQESMSDIPSSQASVQKNPPKHHEDPDWFSPTNSETPVVPPQELGNITEELQLYKQPNFVQKIWSWFSGLF